MSLRYFRLPADVVRTMQCYSIILKVMMVILSDLIEQLMEVFMDDLSVYGKTFKDCLANPDKVIKRCQEADLVLNWEKCHFMV
jgi:hypothetical protein